ncbi:MAG: SDR family oxidoreductase [Candidatus Dadabacteria bacterium]|nr:SDR family oxidoreductase [Candidatus Dadabacteria bacterium]
MVNALENSWALILGASSGFGEAVSLELANQGMNIFGVHLDRRGTLPHVEEIKNKIKEKGREVAFFNINAADSEKRAEVLGEMEQIMDEHGNPGSLKILIHSLAFGTLKPYISEDAKTRVSIKNMEMTLDVMAHSLVYWAQGLVSRKLMGEGGRIFAMTSAGGHRVLPTYGPVSASKAALESHIRQLAVELSPKGITANAIQAGVTMTPALSKIPGSEEIIKHAIEANPANRLTTTEDVAQAIAALSVPGTHFLTGNVIKVDGGEDLI